MRNWLLTGAAAAAVMMAQADIAYAQQITGGLRGQIMGKSGTPVAGATIKVTSNSTGASQMATTGGNGTFSVTSLSVSGTYNVRIDAEGFGSKTLTNVTLSLGETSSLNVRLDELGAAETVVVTGIKVKTAATSIVESSGVSTTFNLADIQRVPTGINNDIKEVIQTSSFAFIDPIGGGDSPPVATMSVAGSNPRCQNFLIDGVQVKDNFGLNSQGYPTARAPIPNEWAEQIQVAPTPYDVEYNDTCGGTINVVTKSGSNDFHGSAYFSYQDASLNGTDYTDINGNKVSPTRPHFVERNYGGTFSGAIIPDKLFFFLGYDELVRSSQPGASAIGPSDNADFVNHAPGVTQSDVDQITAIAKSTYGFNAGNLSDVYKEYNQRYMAKLLWQINDRNKIELAYSHTAGGTLATGGGSTSTSAPSLVLPSNWYRDAEKMETITLHYTGQWTDNLTTEIFVSHLGVHGNQTPLGGTDFPEVYVRTTGANGVYNLGTAAASNANSDDGYVVLGPDIYRHWNYLYYKNDSIKPMATYVLGDHTIKGGIEIHRIGVKNSFTPGAQSDVRFDSISDFQNGIVAQTQEKRSNWRSQANGYSVYYSSGQNGNMSGPDANFQFYTESAFIQDEWYPVNHLKIQAGVRYDQYVSSDKPVLNPYFQQRYGFSNQRSVNGLHAILPRLSLSYSNWVPDQDLIADTAFTFRAGAGRYSGGFQTVWISNSYANTGITSLTAYGYPGAGTFSSIPKVMPTDHQTWLDDLNNGPLSSATVASTSTVNAILPNFKMPTSWRMNAGVDVVFGDGWLGDGWALSTDVLFINFENQPYWTNLRVRQKAGATAPDGRAMYEWAFDTGHVDPVTKGTLTGTDLAMGSKTGGGGTYIITALQKEWKDTGYGDFSWSFGYTHSKGSEVSPETSSTASSSYSYHAGANYNEPEVGTSIYQRDHRFTTSLSIAEKFIWDLESRFNIFATKMSGQHYSLAFRNSPTGVNGSIFGPSGNSFYDSLLYIPAADSSGNVTATSDPNVTYSGINVADVNTVLHQTGLIKYAGHILPRGTQQGPWSSLINVGLEQELPTYFEGHHLVASLNIFNVGNLLNPKWGQYEYPAFFQAYEGATATIVNGKYVFSAFKSAADIKTSNYRVTRASSTYQIKFGVRYAF